MAGPSELIRRARLNARVKTAVRENARAAPQTCASRHTSYTQLMRNHDRVRTQHLTVRIGR